MVRPWGRGICTRSQGQLWDNHHHHRGRGVVKNLSGKNIVIVTIIIIIIELLVYCLMRLLSKRVKGLFCF